MSNDLIRRKEVLSLLEKVFHKYNIGFGGDSGGFAQEVPEAIKSMPAAYGEKSNVQQLKRQKSTKFDCSLNDTTELRNLIIENPDLPLLVFCGEDAWHDNYPYEQAEARNGGIKELTLYDGWWMDKDDYEERLTNDLRAEEEYEYLQDEEYFQMIDQKVADTEFIKAIVIYVG